MQLFACGSNEAANLGLPASCQRYYIRRANPCAHNDWGRDPDRLRYCPNMVLNAVEIAAANHIRVLASLPNATILDLDGELIILGQGYPELLGEKSLVRRAHDIKTVFELNGRTELGILLEGGDLLVLNLGKEGGKTLERHRPGAGRAVYHLAFGQYPARVLAVPRHRPNIILSFASWNAFFEWHKGNDITQPDPQIVKLPSDIDQLVGNLGSFTALLQSGQVFSLAPQDTTSPAAAEPSTTSVAISETTTHSHASPSKADSEESEVSALLTDTAISGPLRPSPPALELTLINIPTEAKFITTHPSSRVTGIIAAEETVYLIGPPPKSNSGTPGLPSLSPAYAPQPIDIPQKNNATIISLAVGQLHAVILTSSGEVYSAGDGKAGQLGIGDRIFGMRAKDRPGVEFHPHADEPEEYADHWERVDMTAAGENQVRELIAGAETTFFLAE